jgi:molybdenum cofactor cytidylyltransferase
MGCILKGNSGLYSRMTVGAVLLAAGAGRRLGGRPKALLELGGVPLIRRQLIALSGAGVDEVVVVLGHHADAIEAAVRAFPITLAHNPRPTTARPRRCASGCGAVGKLDAVIVALADQPLIDAQDITALIGAFKKRGDAAMVVPRVQGIDGRAKPGNPVIFDAALRDEWLAGSADAGLPALARATHPERVRWFDTDNHRYRVDIDTPEDLERFALSTGHRLAWPRALESRETA